MSKWETVDVRGALIWKWIGISIILLPVIGSSGGREALSSSYLGLLVILWLVFTAFYSVGLLSTGLPKQAAVLFGAPVSFALDTIVSALWMVQGVAELEDFWLMPPAQLLSLYAVHSQPRYLVLAAVWALAVYGVGTGIAWHRLLGTPYMGTFWIHIIFSAVYVFGYYRFSVMAQLHEKLVMMKLELEASARELSATNQLLARLSYTDSLTGVFNNRFFYERLEEEINLARKAGGQLALIMLDIDHFKRYNDTYGHRQGDCLLREVARIMSEKCRESDIVCRYGGEEFGIILPGTSRTEAMAVAERIREAVASQPLEGRESQPNGVLTISAGVAVFPDDASTVGELVERADIALYQAKTSGRNAVRFYTPQLRGAISREEQGQSPLPPIQDSGRDLQGNESEP